MRTLLRIAPVLLPLFWFNVTGFMGAEFGGHWDEPQQLQCLRSALSHETLLPHWYNYPSMCFWLGMAALAPEISGLRLEEKEDYDSSREAVSEATKTQPFKLRLRRVFVVASSLAILWVYLLVLLWRSRVTEALLAASCVAGSWEFAYHSRWVAPDAVMAQFGALAMLGVVWAWRRGSLTGLRLATIGAGLACSTKYTGGLLLLPVLLAAGRIAALRVERLGPRLARTALCFAATYLVITPGTLLNPVSFYFDVRFEMLHYGQLGHYGYTVDSWLENARLTLRYVLLDLPSPFGVISLASVLLAAAGAFAMLRAERRLALVFLSLPVLYLAWMSRQVVLFVRNDLVVLPFLAISAAHGAWRLWSILPGRALRLILAGVLTAGIALNGVWLWHSAASIRDRERASCVVDLCGWIAAHPETAVYLSPAVANEWTAAGLSERPNLVLDPGAEVDAAAFYPKDTPNFDLLESNVPGSTLAVFGPLDRNFEYYTNWPLPRLVVAPAELARRWGILPVRDGR
ncbi:MAG: phospholipid carrier-dependent glycosyltransferase [Planctomycetes bacterium]|nr:phospholipid carrier-dependent glycosyltransferase [Planctomycetota bacterium]